MASEQGQGTTFQLYWPTVEERLPPSDGVHAGDRTLTGSETVLLVEDEDLVRDLAVDILRDVGYTVLEARDGRDAILKCRQHAGPIDLLITDMVMPGMNGKELSDLLLSFRPDMRVLYMSGYTDHASLHQDVWENHASFLQKPFTDLTLTQKARDVLDAAQGE